MERSALSPPIRGDGKLIVGQAPIRTNAAVDKLTELMSVRLK
jgi:hypothetical protein